MDAHVLPSKINGMSTLFRAHGKVKSQRSIVVNLEGNRVAASSASGRLQIDKFFLMVTGKLGFFAIMHTSPELAIRSLPKCQNTAASRTNRFDKVTAWILANSKTAFGLQAAPAPLASPLRMGTKRVLVTAEKAAVLAVARNHKPRFAAATGNARQLVLEAFALELIGQDRVAFIDQLADERRWVVAVGDQVDMMPSPSQCDIEQAPLFRVRIGLGLRQQEL
jgi:hypothetical protein